MLGYSIIFILCSVIIHSTNISSGAAQTVMISDENLVDICFDTCIFHHDNICDDGKLLDIHDSLLSNYGTSNPCIYGSDCADCGVRKVPIHDADRIRRQLLDEEEMSSQYLDDIKDKNKPSSSPIYPTIYPTKSPITLTPTKTPVTKSPTKTKRPTKKPTKVPTTDSPSISPTTTFPTANTSPTTFTQGGNEPTRAPNVNDITNKVPKLADEDQHAWEELYDNLGGEQWVNCRESRLSACNCNRITCELFNSKGKVTGDPSLEEGLIYYRITEIDLSNNKLAGAVPENSLLQMVALQVIDLSSTPSSSDMNRIFLGSNCRQLSVQCDRIQSCVFSGSMSILCSSKTSQPTYQGGVNSPTASPTQSKNSGFSLLSLQPELVVSLAVIGLFFTLLVLFIAVSWSRRLRRRRKKTDELQLIVAQMQHQQHARPEHPKNSSDNRNNNNMC